VGPSRATESDMSVRRVGRSRCLRNAASVGLPAGLKAICCQGGTRGTHQSAVVSLSSALLLLCRATHVSTSTSSLPSPAVSSDSSGLTHVCRRRRAPGPRPAPRSRRC
jgi:hypothetical protein